LTGSKLANKLAVQAVPEAAADALFCDPACGAGDLLVATARHLPIRTDLEQTLAEWGERLAGFDLQPLLVRATKTRLALLAISLGASQRAKLLPDLDALFPHIRVADGTTPWEIPAAAFSVLVNPPFTRIVAPPTCIWGSGSVSQAAVFLEAVFDQFKKPTSIHAILPDVLRTGSRYEKWRQLVSKKALVRDATPMGLFDSSTDVDVFTVHFELPNSEMATPSDWGMPKCSSSITLGNKFSIHVGPIVPYRHVNKGAWFPYAHTKALPPWGKITQLEDRIRSTETTFKPPFVLIRRTSRPGDQFRAIGTIVTGDGPIAVENHLLVATPIDRTLSSCSALLKILKSPDTTGWLNRRICCRHLTVGALLGIPWGPAL